MCSAGHPPALIVDRAGTVSEAPAPGPLLGAFADSIWQQEHVPVSDGELVLLYTDGVTETIGDTDRFGVGRLRRLLSEHADASPAQLLAVLDETLEEFRGGPATDDVAALALRPLTARSSCPRGGQSTPVVDHDHVHELGLAVALDRDLV